MRNFLTQLPRYQKRLVALIFDTLCIQLSLMLAMLLRFGNFDWFFDERYLWWHLALTAPITALPFFIRLGLYRAVLRYMSSLALITILKAVLLSVVALIVFDKTLLIEINIPRSVPLLYGLFLAVFMITSRFLMQKWLLGGNLLQTFDQLFRSSSSSVINQGKPVFVYGSGKAITELVSVLNNTREYRPVAIIDTEGDSVGGEISGQTIYHEGEIQSLIELFEPEEVLLAIPELSRHERKKVIQSLERFHLPIKTMPSVEDLASGRMKLLDVQDVDIADVLGRDEVEPDLNLLEKCISKKAVMITGAGGSIGSEITRQVIKYQPTTVIVVENSEFNLYQIDREIRLAIELLDYEIELVSLLASVNNQKRIEETMAKYKVNTVYHAAAYKHVPIVEQNISEGIHNNILGTISTAQAAIRAKVENFVLVSTDKAVRPTNVMGASKRFAEMTLQAISKESRLNEFDTKTLSLSNNLYDNHTRFTMVRFGNVLGSSGSVIPVFKEQIRLGGPITVTHPDINRYFMSIPEAAQLVIHAGAMGEGGDVFVLDMGEPIKIVDLAKRMVQLSGLSLATSDNPNGDIEISYSGLRPGEKLYEELLIGENPKITKHPRIFRADEEFLPWEDLILALENLLKSLEMHDFQALHLQLRENVSGFSPDESIIDWLS